MNDFHESLDRGHIQLLLALRDSGRLALAADVLSISPSAASHRLKEAERRLGVSLAVPDGRSLKLTAGGMHLANVGAMSEATLRSAENAARWLGSASRASVRLAVGFYDSAPWFRDFGADDAMGFRVDLIRIRYGDGESAVDRRVADLAVELRPASASAVNTIANDHLVAVVPADHPAARRGSFLPDDIRGITYLTAGQGPTTGFEHTEFMAPNDAYPDDVVQIESVSLILDLIAAGRGLSIQPSIAVDQAGAARGLATVPLSGPARILVRWQAIVTRHGDRLDDAMLVLESMQERYSIRLADV